MIWREDLEWRKRERQAWDKYQQARRAMNLALEEMETCRAEWMKVILSKEEEPCPPSDTP